MWWRLQILKDNLSGSPRALVCSNGPSVPQSILWETPFLPLLVLRRGAALVKKTSTGANFPLESTRESPETISSIAT